MRAIWLAALLLPGSLAYAALTGNGTATSLASFQVQIGTTPTLIVPASAGGYRATITQMGNSDIYLGGPNVSPTTGSLLPGGVGKERTVNNTQPLYGVVISGNQAVTVLEEY